MPVVGPALRDVIAQIDLPRGVGNVTDRHVPQGYSKGIVVSLQDLHGNQGVQEKQAVIIRHLVERFSFRHVFVEGAVGASDFATFEEIPLAVARSFCFSLLQRAYLTGPELAAIVTPHLEFDIWGIDDRRLYKENFEPAEEIEVLRNSVVSSLQAFRQSLVAASPMVVSRAVRQFQMSVERFAQGALTRPQFIGRLSAYYSELGLTLPESILAPPQEFQQYSLGDYRRERQSADLRSVVDTVFDALCTESKNPNDRQYAFLVKLVDLGLKGFQLAMQRHDAHELFLFTHTNGDLEQRVAAAVEVLNRGLPVGQHLTLAADVRAVLEHWHHPNRFYRIAMERSDRMLENLRAEMLRRKIDRAIIYTGGFHTPHFQKHLPLDQLALITVTPAVERIDDAAYRRRLLEDLNVSDDTRNVLNGSTRLLDIVGGARGEVRQRARAFWWAFVTPFARSAQQIRNAFLVERIIPKVIDVLVEISSATDYEAILVSESNGDRLTARLNTGARKVFGVDRYDYLMGGERIPVATAVPLTHLPWDSTVVMVNGNSRILPFHDASFDACLCINLHRVIRKLYRREAVQEAVRVCKPTGAVAFFSFGRLQETARFLLESVEGGIRRVELARIGSTFGFGWLLVSAEQPLPPAVKSKIAASWYTLHLSGQRVRFEKQHE